MSGFDDPNDEMRGAPVNLKKIVFLSGSEMLAGDSSAW
jgi:hypothetical protein